MKHQRNYMILLCCCMAVMACKTKSTREAARSVQEDTAAAPAQQQANNDEEQFVNFFDAFCEAAGKNDRTTLGNMLYFPFQTARMWVNEELKSMELDKEADKVSRKEFGKYYEMIFHPDVRRLLPQTGDEELAEIDSNTKEDYYLTLRRETDTGSKMYEVYVQYVEQHRPNESYFAFVFGKVKGQYKAISYYAKWPVKG